MFVLIVIHTSINTHDKLPLKLHFKDMKLNSFFILKGERDGMDFKGLNSSLKEMRNVYFSF